MVKPILVLKISKEKDVYNKGVKTWLEAPHERKVLYERMAHIINKINEYEGNKSSFKGFNIWMYKFEKDFKELENFLGVN